jgi:hypothetical protein
MPRQMNEIYVVKWKKKPGQFSSLSGQRTINLNNLPIPQLNIYLTTVTSPVITFTVPAGIRSSAIHA